MRHAKPYRLWKRGKFFYYRLADEGKWISTGKTEEYDAHTVAREELARREAAGQAPPPPPAAEQTLRGYSRPFSAGGNAPISRG